MEFKNLSILAFLSVAIVVCHAALPSEEYWNSALPNTVMPKSVKDLLTDDKSGVNVGVNVGHGHDKDKDHDHDKDKDHDHDKDHGGSHKNHKPVNVNVSPFIYHYAATETQLHDSPNVALFFLEKDLYAGNKMTLQFYKDTNQQKFLTRHVADSIPFSSDKLPEIYTKFLVDPDSDEAEAMKKTIQECEEKGIKGEEKVCATSLESMVDFATSKIGNNVEAVSTEADSSDRKVYRIERVSRKPSDKPVVVCHQQEYDYAVFYCHKTETTVAYDVSLVGAGGSKAEAVAVCHRDTAEWNPKHLAFQVLKVKPGTVPVCHYLPLTFGFPIPSLHTDFEH